MAYYRFTVDIAAHPEDVFDLWVNLDRLHEWTEGVRKVTDVSGRPDEVGTTYTVWFGPMASRTEVLQAERPRVVRTRSGTRLLRGEQQATFDPRAGGTRLTHEIWTQGPITAIAGRVFAMGSYKGSFRGELNAFKRLAEETAHSRTS